MARPCMGYTEPPGGPLVLQSVEVLERAHRSGAEVSHPWTFPSGPAGVVASRRPGDSSERYAEPLSGDSPACTRSECIP